LVAEQQDPRRRRNVVAVRTVADVVDNLSSKVLPDVVRATAAREPQKLRPARGRVDLAPITAVAPSVVRAGTRLAAQAGRVQRIDAGQLVSQVARPVRLLQDRLTEASDLADRTSRAVRLLPPMLGAHGRRTHLLFFQNNAEVRATGGLPGSFPVVTADHGKVSLGRQGPEGLIGRFTRPPTPLTAEENGGALPKRPSPAPQVGVYLNDTGGAKLDYYLDYHVDVTSTRCQAGRQYLSVAVHMRSSVPADPSRLPSDVAGNLNGPTGVIGTTYYVYAPLGGYFDDPGQNDNVKMHDGRQVFALFTQLKPGERQSFTYRMVTGKHQTARTDLQVTPGVHTDGVGTVGAPAC
jgi:Protein of unknown function (DUF4012)